MFDKKIPNNGLSLLAGDFNYDKIKLLKLAIKATGKLEKLNGLMYLIPNKDILISPLLIKESVESSAIENIHTTTVKVLQSNAIGSKNISGPEKEVLNYHNAIINGFDEIKKKGGLGYNTFLQLQKIIEPNKAGIRQLPGTVIADGKGNAIYTPPEGKENIEKLLTNLELFINDFDDDIDALIKMPVIHYQFESIHPFYDGNGRTGRILNVLYLILAKKLDFPIIFLSEYINKHKNIYYDLLGKTHIKGDYTDFIEFLLKGVIEQADKTSHRVLKIKNLMITKEKEIEKVNRDYHKITNLLFLKPFISVLDFEKSMNIANITAIRNIKKLEEHNIVDSIKIGRNKLIFIPEFIELLS